jgi:hypothetical protein
MDLVQWLHPENLKALPDADRARALVSVVRGHSGKPRPYSIPFTYTMTVDGRLAWWALIDFDQLYIKNGYNGPQLLARYCEGLRRVAEGKSQYNDSDRDNATWRAVFASCYQPGDKYYAEPPADMQSRREEFTRKTLVELADADPREFHAYEIQTVTAANSYRSDMRSEFRLISRPSASHRWMFWTHAPARISHDPAELHYWFTRHVAQLRGPRRPKWTTAQRDRWFEHVHSELAGKTTAESRLDALAAAPEEKPDVGLILGGEDAAGGVRRWVIPRTAFTEAHWHGANLRLEFTDADDSMQKEATLLFHSVTAARETIREILSGERRRLGVGTRLRGIIGMPADDEFLVTVGLSPEEEDEQANTFVSRHGAGTYRHRSGLLFQIIAPYSPKEKT